MNNDIGYNITIILPRCNIIEYYSHTSKRYEYFNLYSDDAAAADAAADDE